MRPDGQRVPHPPWPPPERILPSHLAPDCLSVVVFGPGHGEAIVVVLPDGSVGVVDGCREPTNLDPVREFLDELAQAPNRQGQPFRLGFVCMTHPHEDHYRGLWRLLEAHRGRVDHVWRPQDAGDKFVKMWLEYLKHTRTGVHHTPEPDDVEGLTRLVFEMRRANQEHGAKFKHLQQGMILLERDFLGHPLRISGCGPSAADLQTAQSVLHRALQGLLNKRGKAPTFDPNAASGALVVRWGQAGVLLAGDLLCGEKSFKGWDEVHDEIAGPIQVVKAAHHASRGAHHEPLLTRLRPHLTIVTPFLRAKESQPPRPEQIDRLARDSVVAITSEPQWPTSTPLPRAVFTSPLLTMDQEITSGGFANDALAQVPTAGEVDAHNAIAVSLDATGQVVRFVLAGKANVYEP